MILYFIYFIFYIIIFYYIFIIFLFLILSYFLNYIFIFYFILYFLYLCFYFIFYFYFTAIRGYIKTNFNIINNAFKNYVCGFITGGSYKLQVQIIDYKQNSYFEKGECVELKDFLKITSKLSQNFNKILL